LGPSKTDLLSQKRPPATNANNIKGNIRYQVLFLNPSNRYAEYHEHPQSTQMIQIKEMTLVVFFAFRRAGSDCRESEQLLFSVPGVRNLRAMSVGIT